MELERTAQRGLDGLASQLYRIAAGLAPATSFPVRLIADPLVIRAILLASHRFPKNYAFLEDFAPGRFSANDPEWQQRAALTQPHYARGPDSVPPAVALDIYRRRLAGMTGDADDDLYHASIEAALDIVSCAFGLATPVPWDREWLDRARGLLALRQWIGFAGTTPEILRRTEARLAASRDVLADRWRSDAGVAALLEALRQRGEGIAGFDPVDELIQNVLASSETTASSLMWAAAMLAAHPEQKDRVRDDEQALERFIAELLRCYPPVPFLSRVSATAQDIAGQRFVAGEPIVLSIVGMHLDPLYWSEPLRFDPDRAELAGQRGRNVAYHPFSLGPRVCGGMKLARVELRAGVVALSELPLPAGDLPAGLTYGLSLRPKPHGAGDDR